MIPSKSPPSQTFQTLGSLPKEIPVLDNPDALKRTPGLAEHNAALKGWWDQTRTLLERERAEMATQISKLSTGTEGPR